MDTTDFFNSASIEQGDIEHNQLGLIHSLFFSHKHVEHGTQYVS